MGQLCVAKQSIGPHYVPPSYNIGRYRRSDALTLAIKRIGKGRPTFTAGEIFVQTGGNRSLGDINNTIQRMIAGEFVKRVGQGLYRLTGEV